MRFEPFCDGVGAVTALQVIKMRSVCKSLQSFIGCRLQVSHLIVVENSTEATEEPLHLVGGLLQMRCGTLGGGGWVIELMRQTSGHGAEGGQLLALDGIAF